MSSMSSEDYVNIRQIGKGAFGTAHIVQHKVTGERFVLKRVRLARQSARERQSSVKELLLLSNLRHRNVLEFKGCWVEGGCNLCMLVELCESGDLFTQLRIRHPGSIHFSEEHLQEMAVQLLSALAYLHRSNIAHRDLKTANVLITGDGCLKLADFGLSTVLEPETNHLTKTCVGTPNYMSAEVLQERPYGTPNDVWGLGCVLFELSALKPAFQAFNMAGLIKKVTTGPPPPVPSCYSEHWRNLVRAMLTKEPDMRPSAAELLELEWLQPAVRRVAARFGAELPPGAPDLLEKLSDLPPDIMAMMDAFQAQEKDEKRRADEARERRKAAVMKWDPVARAAAAAQAAAAAAAKQPKLPPLKPHVPRKPPPRVSRAPGGPGGPPPRAVPPLPGGGGAIGGGDGVVSPRGMPAAADRVCPRRTTYCGETDGGGGGVVRGTSGRAGGAVAAAGGGPPRRLPHTLPGAVPTGAAGGRVCRSNAAAAWLGPGTRISPPPLPLDRYPQQQRQHCDGQGGGGAMEESDAARGLLERMWSHRPSSAPPDSPVRRSRRGPRDGATPVAADPRVSGRGDGIDRLDLLDGTTSLGCCSTRRTSSFSGDPASASACVASPSGASTASIATRTRSGFGAPHAHEIVHRGKWQQEQRQPGQQQREQHQRQGQGSAQAAGAAEGQHAPGAGQRTMRTEMGLQEDSDTTFRYLPPVRDTTGLGGSGAGPGSASASSDVGGGGGVGGSSDDEDAAGDTAGPGPSVRHSCPVVPVTRRANSEKVLRVTAVPPMAATAEVKAREAPSPQPSQVLLRSSAPLQQPTAAYAAARASAAAPGAAAAAVAAPAAAAICNSNGRVGVAAAGGGSWRPSETTSSKCGAAAAFATGPAPPSAPSSDADGCVVSGACGTASSGSRPGSSHVGGAIATAAQARGSSAGSGNRSASGTGCGTAAGNRRQSGTGSGHAGGGGAAATANGGRAVASGRGSAAGAGSRRSTGTESSLGLGPGLAPRPVSGTAAAAAVAGGSAGVNVGGGTREPPPAAILKPARPPPALGRAGGRPSSASSSRPSSAKQQQAPPKTQLQQKTQQQQRRRQ